MFTSDRRTRRSRNSTSIRSSGRSIWPRSIKKERKSSIRVFGEGCSFHQAMITVGATAMNDGKQGVKSDAIRPRAGSSLPQEIARRLDAAARIPARRSRSGAGDCAGRGQPLGARGDCGQEAQSHRHHLRRRRTRPGDIRAGGAGEHPAHARRTDPSVELLHASDESGDTGPLRGDGEPGYWSLRNAQ